MLNKLILLFSILLSAKVYAGGDRVGNGGDVIVCKNKVELLDIYEAKANGSKLIKPVGANYKEMLANVILTRIKPIQSEKAMFFTDFLEYFESEAAFLPKIKLNDVDDAGMVAIPVGCKLEQIIIQLSERDRPTGKKRYTVSLDLWNKLDEFNKMSLVLHEFFYRQAIELSTTSNSMVVRAMVEQIIKEKIDLDTYLSLDADLSKSIEYKGTYLNDFTNKAYARIARNEFQEDQIIINSPDSFSANLIDAKRELKSLGEVKLRVSDGKILSALTSLGNNSYLYIRANTRPEQVILLKDGQTSFLPMWVETNVNVQFIETEFIGPAHYSIQLSIPNMSLLFTDVTMLENKNHSLERALQFEGNFTLNYRNVILNQAEKAKITVNSFTGEVYAYSIDAGNAQITNELGIFSCKLFANDDNHYTFKDCDTKTQFNVLINKKLTLLELKKPAQVLQLYKDGTLAYGIIQVYISKETQLGKTKDGKMITIQPGVYNFDAYKNGYNLLITSEDGLNKYLIDADGVVTENSTEKI